jgi:hypothetical protein
MPPEVRLDATLTFSERLVERAPDHAKRRA